MPYFTYPRLNLYLELLPVIGFQRFIAEYGKYLSKGHIARVNLNQKQIPSPSPKLVFLFPMS